MHKIILASASPRRRELLKQIQLDFEVIPSNEEENVDLNKSPEEIVKELALIKTESVEKKIKDENKIIIGADTIVVFDNKILGKPDNEKDAYNMLKLLSGNTHEVLTGFAIKCNNKIAVDFEKTYVKFKNLSEEEIQAYINSKEPMDKAGAYGIQGLGSILVEKIEGDYFNVVGFPICKACKILKDKFNILVLD